MTVITSLEYEHVAALGGSLQSIAAAKAGIVKPDGVVVVAPQHTAGASDALHAALEQIGPATCEHVSQSVVTCGPMVWAGSERAPFDSSFCGATPIMAVA